MPNMKERNLHIPKAAFLMGAWGLLILLASIINQFFDLPNPNYVLLLWAGVTVLGIAAQVTGLVRGLEQNFVFWMVPIAAGWIFTLYVVKWDNGAHIDLYGDLAGVWLILLGLGYVATARQVHRRFLLPAALHLVVGVLLELSARGVLPLSFLDSYSTLIFGLVGGVSVLVGALPMWYRPRRPAPAPAAQPAA